MNRRVLMIAFHYPPMSGSSGVQRSLKFSQYLPEFGWTPIVLTAHPRVHPNVSDDQLADVPPGIEVRRAMAFDTARHLAVRGKYPHFLARPDRWMSWWLGAVPAGLRLIRRYRPDAIWSTFPIASAHRIGDTLARISGLPWIADFRDSMTEDAFPEDPRIRADFRRIEERSVRRASKVVFTAPGTLDMYRQRYPELPGDRWAIIENGFDEDSFRGIERDPDPLTGSRPLTLVHSGLLYPQERDPGPFFTALGRLRQAGQVSARDLTVTLRATGHDAVFRPLIEARGIADIVRLAPAIPYRDALTEVMNAGGLLIFQASNCNHQIPAKLYEYLRARRPVFALTDPEGDTAATLRRFGLDNIARIDDADDIAARLAAFIEALRRDPSPPQSPIDVARYSRRAQTGMLSELLDAVASGHPE